MAEERSPLEASKQFVEKICDAELREVRNHFNSIEQGLGEKAAKLVLLFSASFGIRPGEVDVMREKLNDLVVSGDLEYDFELGLFCINGDKSGRFYLDPMNRFGNPVLFDTVMTIAKKMHDAFSSQSQKKIDAQESSMGASVWQNSFYPKLKADKGKNI